MFRGATMKAKITTELLRTLPDGDLTVYDTKYPGLELRCRGKSRTYRVRYEKAGKRVYVTLGRADTIKIDDAREHARNALAQVTATGETPQQAEKKAAKTAITLQTFLAEHYRPWAEAHNDSGKATCDRIERSFDTLLGLTLGDINAFTLQSWRTKFLKTPLKKTGRVPNPKTVNAYLTNLKEALNKAVEWKLLVAHEGRKVKALPTDRFGRVRFLSPEEQRRLEAALAKRDAERAARRARANAWRAARKYK